MARTAVPVQALALNVATTVVPVVADTTNDHNVTGVGGRSERVMLRIYNSDASTRIATIKAGDQYPAGSAGPEALLGDLAISLATTVVTVVVVESARFLQSDGTIDIDLAASFAGTIEAFKLPRQS